MGGGGGLPRPFHSASSLFGCRTCTPSPSGGRYERSPVHESVAPSISPPNTRLGSDAPRSPSPPIRATPSPAGPCPAPCGMARFSLRPLLSGEQTFKVTEQIAPHRPPPPTSTDSPEGPGAAHILATPSPARYLGMICHITHDTVQFPESCR